MFIQAIYGNLGDDFLYQCPNGLGFWKHVFAVTSASDQWGMGP